VGSIQELAGLQEHFHHMLVHMPARGLSWIGMESEDIHSKVALLHFIFAFQFLLMHIE
jgi:hypothetical protein